MGNAKTKYSTYPSSGIETLKYIAILAMTADHISGYFFNGYHHPNIVTAIGRIALPLFVFIMVYNYMNNTKNKVRYIQRMMIAGFISQMPYALTIGEISTKFTTNVFFTLAAGLLLIWGMEQAKKRKEYRTTAVVLAIMIWVSAFVFLEYGVRGVLLSVAFYLFLNRPSILNATSLLIAVFVLSNTIAYMFSGIISLGLIWYFKEEKRNIRVRRIPGIYFYIFYPAHLLLLYAIGVLI